MTDYNYGDIIEYVDGTFDENFNAARKWALTHNTTFEELVDRREEREEEETIEGDDPEQEKTITVTKLYRYFQIGEAYVPTEDEKKANVRRVRDAYLSHWDFTQLDDAPFVEDEKEKYREYRQYLRDYTKQEDWWEQNPDNWETWLLVHYPVTEEE